MNKNQHNPGVDIFDVPKIDWSAIITKAREDLGYTSDGQPQKPVPKRELFETAAKEGYALEAVEMAFKATDEVTIIGWDHGVPLISDNLTQSTGHEIDDENLSVHSLPEFEMTVEDVFTHIRKYFHEKIDEPLSEDSRYDTPRDYKEQGEYLTL